MHTGGALQIAEIRRIENKAERAGQYCGAPGSVMIFREAEIQDLEGEGLAGHFRAEEVCEMFE